MSFEVPWGPRASTIQSLLRSPTAKVLEQSQAQDGVGGRPLQDSCGTGRGAWPEHPLGHPLRPSHHSFQPHLEQTHVDEEPGEEDIGVEGG